ncbi:phosphate uptake regulator PhoU [Haloarcula halophila]|uniref:phosphate uptake regulator PhoU n=1 Tax=Haloarcula TaxID=2237 RepID=UPI0023E43EA1|nr:phosphate uptake regulator PhoU [Halomicroarcula sp. DFY41]
METRKVQLSGGTTYTVSLPKSWANEHGIDAGSILSLYPNDDGTLLVEADADISTDTRSATVDVSTASEDAVRQRIHALHAVGFDSVTLVDRAGHADEVRALVENTVSNLSGFELLEAGETRIKLTNLIDADNVDIRKSTLRLRLVMLGMHRDAVSAVLDGDEALARRVVDRDSEADKLFAMVTRHFRRALTNLQEVEKLGDGRDELFEYYYVCRQFERIADHAEKIARFAIDPEATVPADLAERIDAVAASARQVVDTAADVVLADADIESAHTALATRAELTAELRAIDRDLYAHDDPAEAYVVGLLLDSIRRTAEYGGNVADIAIQQVTRECNCVE